MRTTVAPRASVWLVAMIVLSGSACDVGRDTTLPTSNGVRATSAVPSSNADGCPLLPPAAERPKGMIDVGLPEGSVFVEPASLQGKGVRADLFIPLSVKQGYQFFLTQAQRRSRQVVFKDYEGFEAEVFFREADGTLGLIRILITCYDGSMVSVETFKD